MDYAPYLDLIDSKRELLCRLSDGVWDAAELAFSERKSASLLAETLRSEGFSVTAPAFGIETAFTASFGSGKPVIGLLGEFDALGGLSQKSGSFVKEAAESCTTGHGCGHNMLGVGALGAALAVKKYLAETGASGTVVYYGCPGEEGGSGKAFMAREGAFSGLDCALTWHPYEASFVYIDSSLANIQVLYRFHGVSSHAAGAPEMGRSALDALELMNVGVNFLREHMVQEARVHYAITNTGGVSPNVVQNYAEALYLIRAPKVGQMRELYARVNKIAEGAALMTETRTEREFVKSCYNFVSNRVLEKALHESLSAVPLPSFMEADYEYAARFTATVDSAPGKLLDKVADSYLDPRNVALLKSKKTSRLYDFVLPYEENHLVKAGAGSTDVGDVSWNCPTAQFYGLTWAPNSPGHSWQVVAQGKGPIAHKGTLHAGKVLARTAIGLFSDPQRLEAARAEFDAVKAGEAYEPIPADARPRPMDGFGA